MSQINMDVKIHQVSPGVWHIELLIPGWIADSIRTAAKESFTCNSESSFVSGSGPDHTRRLLICAGQKHGKEK